MQLRSSTTIPSGLAVLLGGVFVMSAACGPQIPAFAPERGPLAIGEIVVGPCDDDPCAAPNTICVEVEDAVVESHICECVEGFHVGSAGNCTDEVCDPNPCTEVDGKSICSDNAGTAECSCNPAFFEDDGSGGCAAKTGDADLGELEGTDLSAEEPVYDAKLRVLNIQAVPIVSAKVVIDEEEQETDVFGEVVFSALPAASTVTASVSSIGYVQASRDVTFSNSGDAPLDIVLLPIGNFATMGSEAGGTIDDVTTSVSFPPNAFAADPSNLAIGDVSVSVTSVVADDQAGGAVPTELVGAATGGDTVQLEMLTMVDVEIKDQDGYDLILTPLPGAALSFILPADTDAEIGDILSLWAFNEEEGIWGEESECAVVPIDEAEVVDGRDKRCEGLVHHFSKWMVAKTKETACLTASIDIQNVPERYSIVGFSTKTQLCNGSSCDDAALDTKGGVKTLYIPPSKILHGGDEPTEADVPKPFGAQCTLVAYPNHSSTNIETTFVGTIVDKDNPSAPATKFVYTFDQTDIQSLSDQFGKVQINQLELEPEIDCQNTQICKEAHYVIDWNQLVSYSDNDGDGYFTPNFEGADTGNITLDCDDTRSTVYPWALEDPCNGRDDNCDGVADPFTEKQDIDTVKASYSATFWNVNVCENGCNIATEEVPSDPGGFDEDCDGQIPDADDDGFYAKTHWEYSGFAEDAPANTWDCNDANANANPDGVEMPGNNVDEDCDGARLDQDGDGYFHKDHMTAAEAYRTRLENEGNLDQYDLQFGDCRDARSDIYPDRPISSEAYFAEYFTVSDQGVHVRNYDYCYSFDETGELSYYANYYIEDKNCDNLESDLDGDGYTEPGDFSLGYDNSGDCDDYDPRKRPIFSWQPVDNAQAGDSHTIGDTIYEVQCFDEFPLPEPEPSTHCSMPFFPDDWFDQGGEASCSVALKSDVEAANLGVQIDMGTCDGPAHFSLDTSSTATFTIPFNAPYPKQVRLGLVNPDFQELTIEARALGLELTEVVAPFAVTAPSLNDCDNPAFVELESLDAPIAAIQLTVTGGGWAGGPLGENKDVIDGGSAYISVNSVEIDYNIPTPAAACQAELTASTCDVSTYSCGTLGTGVTCGSGSDTDSCQDGLVLSNEFVTFDGLIERVTLTASVTPDATVPKLSFYFGDGTEPVHSVDVTSSCEELTVELPGRADRFRFENTTSAVISAIDVNHRKAPCGSTGDWSTALDVSDIATNSADATAQAWVDLDDSVVAPKAFAAGVDFGFVNSGSGDDPRQLLFASGVQYVWVSNADFFSFSTCDLEAATLTTADGSGRFNFLDNHFLVVKTVAGGLYKVRRPFVEAFSVPIYLEAISLPYGCGVFETTCGFQPQERFRSEQSDCTYSPPTGSSGGSGGSSQCKAVNGAVSLCVESASEQGVFLCAPVGWETRLPETTLSFGLEYSPCDLNGVLPGCPTGSICGAAINADVWLPEYTDILAEKLWDTGYLADEGYTIDTFKAALVQEYVGTCFPTCEGTTGTE